MKQNKNRKNEEKKMKLYVKVKKWIIKEIKNEEMKPKEKESILRSEDNSNNKDEKNENHTKRR